MDTGIGKTRPVDEAPLVCACGLPMTRNPHPEAGDPGMKGLLVGHVWVCIPCTVGSRHRWANRALRAEAAIARHRSATMNGEGWNQATEVEADLWATLEPVERTVVEAPPIGRSEAPS